MSTTPPRQTNISQQEYIEVVNSFRSQEFLLNFTNLLNSNSVFENRINNALNILGKYLLVNRIYIIEDLVNSNVSSYEWTSEGISPWKSKGSLKLIKPEVAELEHLIVKEGILYITEPSTLPTTVQNLLHTRQVKSMVALPIFIQNDLYGFVGIDNCYSVRSWNTFEIGFLKTIASIFSMAFERRKMERDTLSAIIQAEEKERGRIARDIHDGLAPLLSGLKMYTKILGNNQIDEQRRCEIIQSANEALEESLLIIKEITNNLSSHVLNDFGLASAIQSFCKKISIAQTIEIRFDSNVFDQRFGQNIEYVIFRILKELVNNTIKHALATKIEIFLLRTDNYLTLVYSDNGKGFDFKKVLDNRNSGMGISNIINRLTSIKGKLMFESQPAKGIQVKIEVTLK